MDGGFRYCPECGAEYRAGFTRCHDCQVELVDEPPEISVADETELDEGGPLVEVFAASHIEADIVRAALEDNGIHAVIARDTSAAYPLTVGALGEGRVLVPEEDGQAALEIIGTLDDEDEAEEYGPEIFAERTSKDWTWWVALVVAVAMILLLVVEIRY